MWNKVIKSVEEGRVIKWGFWKERDFGMVEKFEILRWNCREVL